jgi:GNAT superfamily N-acetyltransferase
VNDPSFIPRDWAVLGGMILLGMVLLVVLEGRRQTRKLRSQGQGSSQSRTMMAAGVLELQGMLQPDRHVEQIQEEARDKDRFNPAHRAEKEGQGGPPGVEAISIGPAEPGMAAALSAVAFRAKSHWGYPAAWLEEWRPELTVSESDLTAIQVIVALADGQPVGFYALAGRGTRLELGHLWVDPPFMGQGLGRRLLTHALREAARLGASEVEVVSDPNAEAFYRLMGAHPSGSRSAPVGGQARELPVLILPVSAEDES